ncbi:MAG TPA: DNA-formamidopyrimidine glycosylase family protein [Sporolactobacillaceae bacterium]|nr:DNA-formamidopyrimidine glycosylase family protein [Sporolactobacillaceae bacterium]
MPELPEMEHYKEVLMGRVLNKPITDVRINRPKSINKDPSFFKERLIGQEITAIERRAKFLAFHLTNKDVLLLHLMLGGKMYYGQESTSPDHEKQVILEFGEEALFFIGLRLGYLHLLTTDELKAEWAKLGPEPLSSHMTETDFFDRLKRKRGKLKAVLVDQSFIAGIGNRYSDEINFEAALSPKREVSQLTSAEGSSLFLALRQVLTQAIQAGGYLDLPVFEGDTVTGGAEKKMKVHGLAGHPCPRCGATLVEEKVSSKKTSYCPNCQH